MRFGDWLDVRWKRKEGARNFDDVSTWAMGQVIESLVELSNDR